MNKSYIASLFVVLVLAIGGGVWFFMHQTPETTPVTEQDTDSTNSSVYTQKIPQTSSPESSASQEKTTQDVPAEPEASMEERNGMKPESLANSTAPAEKPEPQTDRLVRPAFIQDLASMCLKSYLPPHSMGNATRSPLSTLSFKKLNMHYGVDMTGLETGTRDVMKARDAVFSYLLTPRIMSTVYSIYADSFVQELSEQATHSYYDFTPGGAAIESRVMNAKECQQMREYYAELVREVGATFTALGSHEELPETMRRYRKASKRVTEAYIAFADLEAQGASSKRLDNLSQEIKQALGEREHMKSVILSMAPDADSRSLLAHSDILDIANWIARRFKGTTNALPAIQTIGTLSQQLAGKLEQKQSIPTVAQPQTAQETVAPAE